MAKFRIQPGQDGKYLEVKAEVERKRQYYASQKQLLYDLVFVIGPDLSRRYLQHLGKRENLLSSLHGQCKRLQLKIALIRQALNRNEQPDDAEVEKCLDRQFGDYCLRWQQTAETSGQEARPTLSPAAAKAFQTRYRRLAKRLHPDSNPQAADNSERGSFLWNRIQEAYRQGEPEELEILEEAADVLLDENKREQSKPKPGTDPLVFWEMQNIDIDEQISNLAAKLTRLQQPFPYKYRDILDNPAKLKQTQREMDKTIRLYRKSIRELETELKNLALS
jgi:hypothetical protein